MGQVVIILIENAMRYGRYDGHPDVVVHYAKGHYVSEFTDDDPDVSCVVLPDMFKRFPLEENSQALHSGESWPKTSI